MLTAKGIEGRKRLLGARIQDKLQQGFTNTDSSEYDPPRSPLCRRKHVSVFP
jgi:hypothetical protein